MFVMVGVKKKRSKKFKLKLASLQQSIAHFKNSIDVPTLDKQGVTTNVDIDIGLKGSKTIYDSPIIKNFDDEIDLDVCLGKDVKSDALMKTEIHKLFPTDEQKVYLLRCCDVYIETYNACVSYLKEERIRIINERKANPVVLVKTEPTKSKGKKIKKPRLDENAYCNLDIKMDVNVLKKHLSELKNTLCSKENIRNKNPFNIKKGFNINKHILDYAINDFVSMFKSIVTNQRHGNVKKSKMKRIKKTKNLKIFKIEKHACQDNGFYVSKLGKILKIRPSLNYKEDCKTVYIIQYNKRKDEFLLFRRTPVERLDAQNVNSCIAIDLGTRTLITGIADDHVLEIGKGFGDKIGKAIKQINNIESYEKIGKHKHFKSKRNVKVKPLSKEKIKKVVDKKRERLNNIIDDIQWKCANYLTKNYNDILVGNVSIAGMKKHNSSSIVYETMKASNMYKLRSRISYKCLVRGNGYKTVDEAYTTKCCVNCGKITEIGSSKVYTCKSCKLTYDRDVKSAGCIYLKSLTLPLQQ
jgi:IS605 OrfB family transposase